VKVKEHKIPYSPVDQLRYVFPYQSYHLCSELDGETKDVITEITNEYTLLKRYDWECHPIFQ